MTRVAVFIDYQNAYMGAREAMGWKDHPFTYGQVFPRRLAIQLVDLGRAIDPGRELEYVRVFRGEPSAKHNRVGQAACHRQVGYWNAQNCVEGVTRPLKYHREADGVYHAREKGIDVLIALRLVMGAMRDEYDVAVLVSGDSDLAPALETVLELGKRCEVASWKSRDRKRTRLSLPGRSTWCHWLDETVYNRVRDDTDYTRPRPGGTAGAPS